MAATKKATVAIERAEPHVIVMDGRMNRQLFAQIAVGAVKAGVAFLQAQIANDAPPAPAPAPLQLPPGEPDRDVMTADEVAAFLGVDHQHPSTTSAGRERDPAPATQQADPVPTRRARVMVGCVMQGCVDSEKARYADSTYEVMGDGGIAT